MNKNLLQSTSEIQKTKLKISLLLLPLVMMAFIIQGFAQTSIAWQKSIGTVYDDKAISIFQDLHGNTIVVGKEPHMDFTGNVRDYMMLTKLDPDGHQIWKTYHDVALETFSLPVEYSVGGHFYTEEFGDTLFSLIIHISGRSLQYRVLDRSGDYYFYEELPAAVIDINKANEKVYASVRCSFQQSCYGPDSLIVERFDPTPDDSTFNPIVWTFAMKQNFRTAPIQGHYDFNVQDIRMDVDGNVFLLVQIERWNFQFCTDCPDAFVDAWCEVFKFDKHGVLVDHINLKTAKAVVSTMRFIRMYDDNMLIQINDINAAGTKVLSSVYRVSKDLTLEKKYDLDNLFQHIRADSNLNILTVRNIFDANDPNIKGVSDILISSYSNDGVLNWKQYFGGSSWEYPQGLSLADDGGIFFLANTESTDFDITENFGSQDIWLVKLLEGGSTAVDHSTKPGSLSVFPNPSSDYIYIDAAESLIVSVFDMHGRKLMNQEVNASDVRLDMQALPGGTYLVKGINETGQEFIARVVKM